MSTKAERDLIKSEFVTTREAAGNCHRCQYLMPKLVDCARAYFRDGSVRCDHCGERVDLWQAMLDKALRLSMAPGWALFALGAGDTSFVMPIETAKYYQIELTNYDVPPNAKILTRNYTCQGGDVTAVEWHPNAPPLRFPGTVLHLVGIPLGEGPLPRMGRVAIKVIWIRSEDSEAWPYLVTAFEAAAAREYGAALVFAQSAVEISMMPVIESQFRRHAPEKRVSRFTNYSRASHVILPYLCGEAGISQMPASVCDALDGLRNKRNTVVHNGTKSAAITPEDAMKGLCAAAFGLEYMRYVEPLLSAKKNAATKGQP